MWQSGIVAKWRIEIKKVSQNGTQFNNYLYLCSLTNIHIIMVVATGRDLGAELRGALIEAKESIEGKRKLNTLDNLINELRDSNL